MKRLAAAVTVLALAAMGSVLATEPPAKPVAESKNDAPKPAEDFLAQAAAEKGAVTTPSGLIYLELRPGKGGSPKLTDTVSVNYRGTLPDGKVFDSSYDRGRPATFPLDAVIACWTEGLGKMKVGGKSKLVCPASIAYGERSPTPLIKPGSTLVFEVELLGINKK